MHGGRGMLGPKNKTRPQGFVILCNMLPLKIHFRSLVWLLAICFEIQSGSHVRALRLASSIFTHSNLLQSSACAKTCWISVFLPVFLLFIFPFTTCVRGHCICLLKEIWKTIFILYILCVNLITIPILYSNIVLELGYKFTRQTHNVIHTFWNVSHCTYCKIHQLIQSLSCHTDWFITVDVTGRIDTVVPHVVQSRSKSICTISSHFLTLTTINTISEVVAE